MDMLVKLYDVKPCDELVARLSGEGIAIKRALAPDKRKILRFIEKEFGDGWAGESEAAFAKCNPSCFIAVKDHEVVGFACFDATARDFFGPTGVAESMRGKGVGAALLVSCMLAMRDEGYVYAIIGGASDARAFYEKTVGAIWLDGTDPGIYSRMA